MTALSEEVTPAEVSQSTVKPNSQTQTKEQLNQSQKDRTLFCINIDQNCSEGILYELFLQVGPIDNIVRKADRNGNIIALITYKHVESCDYAIKLFNGIKLFNQSLKVQQSQPGGQLTAKSSSTNLASGQNTPSNPTPQNRYNRKSFEPSQQQNEQSEQQMQGLMFPPQNLLNLMSPLLQQLSPLINQNMNQYGQQNPNSFNRSFSGPNAGNSDVDYRQSRRNQHYHENHHENRHHHQHHQRGNSNNQQHYNRRDNSNQDRDFRENRRSFNRSRSRSPFSKRRR